MSDRKENTHDIKVSIMDMEWRSHPEFCGRLHEQTQCIEKPTSFEEMKQIANRLATGYPFVRIDFYEIESHPIFGEMTFTPGFDTVNNEFEKHIGKLIKL